MTQFQGPQASPDAIKSLFNFTRGAASQSKKRVYLHSGTKRSFDVTIAVAALVILFPILIMIALLIATTSNGPVFFRQRRHGAGRTEFEILKFRTMRHADDAVPTFQQASRGDPRITRLGAVLRRTSIDELPQLINVLRGDMSIVGPRPHPIQLDEQFTDVVTNYNQRFLARPGLTGLAQVNGARGETKSIEAMQRRISLDVDYINTATLWEDVKIVSRTSLELVASRTAF